ncbi:LysR family transcriptional regulator, partial [Advenella sp. FME57]
MSLDSVDRRLRFFVSIADLGSLSKAATVLDQTQSGLSKQLAL